MSETIIPQDTRNDGSPAPWCVPIAAKYGGRMGRDDFGVRFILLIPGQVYRTYEEDDCAYAVILSVPEGYDVSKWPGPGRIIYVDELQAPLTLE